MIWRLKPSTRFEPSVPLILSIRWVVIQKKKGHPSAERGASPQGSYPKSAQHERRGIKEHWLPLWIIFFIAGMREPLWNAQWEKSPVRNSLQTWLIPFKKSSHWSWRSPSFILAHNKPSVHKLQLQLDNWITCWKINCGCVLLHFILYVDWTAAQTIISGRVRANSIFTSVLKSIVYSQCPRGRQMHCTKLPIIFFCSLQQRKSLK